MDSLHFPESQKGFQKRSVSCDSADSDCAVKVGLLSASPGSGFSGGDLEYPPPGPFDAVLRTNGIHSNGTMHDNMDSESDVFSMSNGFSAGDLRWERRRRRFKGLMAAVLYGTSSAGMAFANKAILTFYEFNYSYFLMFCQVTVSIVVLETLRNLKLIKLPRFTVDRGRIFMVPSMLYAVYSVLALSSLSKMSIAMYDVIRRCGPLATLLVGWLILKTDKPNAPVSTSIILITAGCIIAGEAEVNSRIKVNGL